MRWVKPIKRVPYKGTYHKAGGAPFQAKDKHAHVLVTVGKCEYSEAPKKEKQNVEPPKVTTPTPTTATRGRRSPTQNRSFSATTDKQEKEKQDEKEKPESKSNTYQTRDMKADNT